MIIDDLVNSHTKLVNFYAPSKLWKIAKTITSMQNETLSDVLRAKLAEYVKENLDLLNLQVTTIHKEIKIDRNKDVKISLRRVETDVDGLPIVPAKHGGNGWIATCPICQHVIGYLTRPDPRNIETCPKCQTRFHVKPLEAENSG